MDSKGTKPASDGTATTLHVPLAGASSAEGAMAQPIEHDWSVLAAILLIVAAVAWSLLRQRATGRK
jgi:hypothetical protein